MTDNKIDALKEDYPGIETDTLLELLAACDGSVTETRSMINESFPTPQQKRKAGTLYQTSITSLIAPVSKCKKLKTLSGRKRVITLNTVEEVEQHLSPYVSFHKSFLPPDLANRILKYLMTQTDKVSPHEFYLFDNLCKANHSLGFFHTPNIDPVYENLIYNGKKGKSNLYNKDFEDVSTYVKDFMNNNIIPNVKRLPFQPTETWNSDVCVVNYFESLSNNLDWHSDRMSHIGPHNFIASISLGATREFRLRKNYSVGKDPSPIYSIIIPHNSMVIMQPGCQEEYKHSVNALRTAFQVNSISGSARFNLTFRFFPLDFIKQLPRCRCDLAMTLRRSFKAIETRGKYFWSCENKYQNKDCGCFYWANFDNIDDNFRAESEETASQWIAPEDHARLAYLQSLNDDKK
ncbi:uncharacterized protein AC631_05714 [Debaryomyces fabryi]|uniref:Uncharacterized protein n=1 Tax=Debaryomyces fabryi TaxID=58627 RepID=A0A0V1PQJ9_9ASCO|nr:uncharacterized protein AC631_05714 [Debaryomyces fabryi]KRZ98524.1 hypothetical protein AC631_05714 [Debaryomyces fabryi]CUM45907.1 unnamed protein product [Debaryomyces fabryi]